MSKTEVRKFLAKQSSHQLIQELLILHERFPQVREYFSARLQIQSGAELFAKYARQIDQEFSTTARNPTGRPSKGRQIVRAYKRVGASNEDLVELTLYYVSAVLTFMRTFGIHEEGYVRTVISAFREAAEVTATQNLARQLAGSFAEVVDEATETSEDLATDLRDLADQYGLSLA